MTISLQFQVVDISHDKSCDCETATVPHEITKVYKMKDYNIVY